MSHPSESCLLSEASGAVLTLTLNRPASRNALSREMVGLLGEALSRFRDDPALRAAVITGADPAFCAGLDLDDYSAPDAPRAEVGALIRAIPGLGKPLIAAVNGAAVTGGLDLALACDFILASDQASFRDTHARIGALSGSGMSSRLPHAIGVRWAKQMILACEPIDAATALRIGLVNEVLPHADLLGRARQLAEAIAGHEPGLVAIARSVLDQGAQATLADAIRIEGEALAARKAEGPMPWSR